MKAWLSVLALLGNSLSGTAQHAHINAGAFDTHQDAQLYFVNGDSFLRESGYVVGLEHTNEGKFAGLYEGSISFTALPATPLNGGPAFDHAAPGSFIELEIQSAEGPAGATFAFWEASDTTQSISLLVGTMHSTNRFALSEGAPSDPYGHIHGRVFTATHPGLYSIGFRIIDTSKNGANGGPIHTASDPVQLLFQAGLTLSELNYDTNQVRATFGTRQGNSYYLERSDQVGSLNWLSIDGLVTGNNHLQTLTDSNATNTQAIYRLRQTTP